MPLDLAQARLAVPLLERYFFSRSDAVAIGEKGRTPQPAGASLRAVLSTHVAGIQAPPATVRLQSKHKLFAAGIGHFRVGSYCLNEESRVRWLCLDFDAGSGHANALDDPTGTALAAQDAFAARGVSAYLERSGGGHGWHVWVFFRDPVPAAKARRLAFHLAPRDALLADGRVADPKSGHGIEVFPKQDRVTKGGFGNLVWLPWWCDAAPDGNVFMRVSHETGALEPWFPEDFETLEEAQLDATLAALDAEAAARVPIAASGDPTIDVAAFEFPPDEASASPDWKQWRIRAVAALSLESVYGQWLTGEHSSPGWLQCRDPWSPSGDQNPSAGVADGTGEAERGTFHSFRSGQSMSVFDFLARSGKAGGFADALKQVAALVRVAMPEKQAGVRRPEAGGSASTPSASSSGLQPQAPGLPRIVTNGRQLRHIVGDAWRAIHHRNRARLALFRRGARMVRLFRVERPSPQVFIEQLDEAASYGVLMRSADWVRAGQEGEFPVPPIKDVARELLSSPHPELPELEGIIEAPAFGSGGDLVSAPGYNARNCVWYEPHAELDGIGVPAAPTEAEVADARALLLDELLVDFPFVSDSDRAHCVAAIMLPFARRLINGCTPLHAFEAPAKGCGKNLLCECVAMIATGRQAEVSAIPEADDEMRKAITARLSGGASILLLDNARERVPVDSPSLAAALTAQIWSDRLLGQSRTLRLPNNATWLLTGNNPRFSMEIARRAVRIRIDPKMDRAWLRKNFRHVPLKGWIAANRASLVRAVLVLVQAWIAAGRPLGSQRLGSFEEWSEVLGGILSVAGIPGFLGNLEELYENSDAEGEEWRQFVTVWWQTHGSEAKRAAELNELCEKEDLMPSVRGSGLPKAQHMRLAKALSNARDRVFGCLRIVQSKDLKVKACLYALVTQDPGESNPHPDRSGGANPLSEGPSQLDLLPDDDPSRRVVPDTTRQPPAGPPANATQANSNAGEAPSELAGGAGGSPRPPCARAGAHAHAHTRAENDFHPPHHTHHTPGSAEDSESEGYDTGGLAGGQRVVPGPPARAADLSQFADPDDEPSEEDDP
jgi:hypothetical protein